MSEKLTLWFALLVLFIATANIAIVLNYAGEQEGSVTGRAVEERFVIGPAGEAVENAERCCTFTMRGDVKSCYALQKYGCGACKSVCLRKQ